MGTRRQDPLARRARRENFPARSVYKLEEIDRRVRLVRPGLRVLDLGAAPGSWTLYLSRAVGPAGRVVAVDVQELRIEPPPNVRFLLASCFDAVESLAAWAPFDLVVSDMAPSTTGDRGTDQYRSAELLRAAADLAGRLGRPGSDFVGKIFQGPEFEAVRGDLRERWEQVRVIRPRATRTESYEVFLVARGRRG